MFETNFLISTIIFSSIGMGYCLYGKKQQKYIPLLSGVGLTLYPYFTSNIYIMILLGIIFCLIPFISNYLRLE